MLREVEKRKPDVVETDNVAVEFANGRWLIPKPWLEIRPVFENGKAVRSYHWLAYGVPVDDLVESIATLDGFEAIATVVATVAAVLLRQNYDLTEPELDQILAYRPDDATSFEWGTRVVEIAAGQYGRRRGSEVSNGG